MRFTFTSRNGRSVPSSHLLKSRLVSAASCAVTSGSVRQPASLSSLHAPLLSWGVVHGQSSPRDRTSRTISPSGRGKQITRPMLCTAVLPAVPTRTSGQRFIGASWKHLRLPAARGSRGGKGRPRFIGASWKHLRLPAARGSRGGEALLAPMQLPALLSRDGHLRTQDGRLNRP